MSLGAKIGIVGLGVLALVAGGLYYIFVYARNGVKETVTGINRDATSATNAARDPGAPIAIDPDGTPRYGGLIEFPQRANYQIQPVLNSTSVSLAGGAQNMAALPAFTGNPLSLNTPARGMDIIPEIVKTTTINPQLVHGADQLQGHDPNFVEGYNSNFDKGLDAFGVQVQKYFQDAQTGQIFLYPMKNGLPYAWENVKAQYRTWTGVYDPVYGGNVGGHEIFMPESVPIGTIDQKAGMFGGN